MIARTIKQQTGKVLDSSIQDVCDMARVALHSEWSKFYFIPLPVYKQLFNKEYMENADSMNIKMSIVRSHFICQMAFARGLCLWFQYKKVMGPSSLHQKVKLRCFLHQQSSFIPECIRNWWVNKNADVHEQTIASIHTIHRNVGPIWYVGRCSSTQDTTTSNKNHMKSHEKSVAKEPSDATK